MEREERTVRRSRPSRSKTGENSNLRKRVRSMDRFSVFSAVDASKSSALMAKSALV